MALVKLAKEGYGQLERNRFQNHNIEAQCELDASTFANGAEVGSIVAVDKPAGKIKLVGEVYGLLSNAEVLYNPMEMGLKDYHVEPGKMAVVNFLEVGNTFTTNTVKYDEAAYANGMADIKASLASGDAIYAAQDSTDGYIALASTKASEGVALQVVRASTMPDGQDAWKFIVLRAQ